MNTSKNILPLIFLLAPLLAFSQPAEHHKIDSIHDNFAKEIHKKREEAGLVGLSVLVMKDGAVALAASSGERKKGSGVPVTGSEKWHIGSITKSFTSTMIARLIEKEQLQWNTRVGDAFLGEDIHDAWREVTLAQLLTHTSGAKANFSLYTTYYKQPKNGEKLAALRARELLEILRKPPEKTPGSTFIYSNLGYTLAAAMIEKITGLDWSELVAREVLAPLKMQSSAFGPPPVSGNELEQPVGHKKTLGITSPISPTTDLSPILAPAGRLYLTLADLAIYANDHLLGELGKGALLQTETYHRLHTPVMGEYGYGWVTRPATDWSKRKMLWHNGSNGWWHTLMVLIPDSQVIVLVATNEGNFSVTEKNAWEITEIAVKTLNSADTRAPENSLPEQHL